MSLTIGSSKNLNEMIASMLAQMNGTTSTATPSAASTSPPASTSVSPVSTASSAAKNAVVGSGKASYSNEIMHLFSQMHQSVSTPSSGSSTSSSSSTTTTIASATTLATPIDSILSSIETDNDTAATAAAATDTDASDSDASGAASWNAHMRAIRPDA